MTGERTGWDRDQVIAAIGASWSLGTSAWPSQWSIDNPAKGQCEVSAFVAWELLGGEIVHGQVHVDGEFQEFHYWNRIDGSDLDLTKSQFEGHETITVELTRFGGHLILDGVQGKGGPDGSFIEVSRGVPA